MLNDGEEVIDRLEGCVSTVGGLEIRKKPNDDDKLFKHPGRSLLGLDRLAHLKRESYVRKRALEEESPGGLSESTRRNIARCFSRYRVFSRCLLLLVSFYDKFYCAIVS